MNNRQKELLKHQLKSEKEILSELKKIYESSLSEIDEKIQILLSDELTQSKIYRIEYQKALKGQVSAILENLNSNQYESVSDYLKDCYEDGFIGTLYDLQGQGIPLIFPINQEEIVEAIILDSKISEGLYTKMGNDIGKLKKSISEEISRGISTASPYAEIARNIRSHANITVNQSMRIVRTEGNRIHNRSALDAALKAKARGADTVKVWDATLDGVTRPHHRQLDGQVRELEEDFEVDGLTACAPLNFGVAAEDCNCRCVLLTKPRWDLDGAFTKRNNETGELMHFDNVKDYYDFKQKYWDYIDNSGGSGIIKLKDCNNFSHIENYLSKTYNIELDNSVKKLNFETCKSVLQGAVTLISEYPELGRNLQKVTTSKYGVMCCTGKEICFNSKYFKSSDNLSEMCKSQSTAGFWAKNSSPASIGVHETAHAIEQLLIDLNSSYDYDWQKTLAWNDCTEAKIIVSQAIKDVKKTAYGKGKTKEELVNAISRYACKTSSETMAEAFADVYANGDNANPLSLIIKKLTHSQYLKYKKGGN